MEHAAADPDAEAGSIAIAIACYNQAHFLAEALDSALAQTRPAAEIIVVDDGSTDDTAAVAARYPKVRYVRQANAGLSTARNAGLAAAASRYVLFLDADDTLAPETLARAGTLLDSDPELAFVYGGYRDVDADGELIWAQPVQPVDDVFTSLLARGNFIAMHGTVLYDAERLRTAGGFDPGLPSCEDFDVFLRLSRHHRAAAYDLIAANYRRHGASMSANHLRMIAVTRQVAERHAQNPREVALARQGIRSVCDYYGKLFYFGVSGHVRRGAWGAVSRDLCAAIRTPASHGPILRAGWKLLRAKLGRKP